MSEFQFPEQINTWLEALRKQYRPKIAAAQDARDRAIAAAECEAAPHRDALSKARQELAAALASLDVITATTQLDDIVRWETIRQHWPKRIDELAARVVPFDEQIRRAESDFSSTMRSYQGDLSWAVEDVKRHLEPPNVYKL